MNPLKLAPLILLAACTSSTPTVVTSGNYVTITHRVLTLNRGRALANEYCHERNLEARHIRNEVRTRTVSYYECVEPGTKPPPPAPQLKLESK